jgi:CheY-like chemotaxis protein
MIASVHTLFPQSAPRSVAVLVVEDEIMVRLMVADDLRDAGFVVIEAANADEALTVLRSSAPVDLVLTDIRMPGSLDGLALASAVRETWPDLKIIVASGDFPARPRPEIVDATFSKPYDIPRLIRRIKELLSGSNA